MLQLSQIQWVKILVFFAIATLVAWFIHFADDIIQDEETLSIQVFFLLNVAVATLFVFGILWAWAGKQYGYSITGLGGLWYLIAFDIVHAFGLDALDYTEIAARATPEGWAPVFVGVGLVGGVTSLATVIIAVYLLVKARQTS